MLMAAVALGLAMAHTLPLYRLHYALLPQFRAPTRLLFFWTIGAAVQGSLGLDALLRRAGKLRSSPGACQAWVPAATAGLLLAMGAHDSAPDWRHDGRIGHPGLAGGDSARGLDNAGCVGRPEAGAAGRGGGAVVGHHGRARLRHAVCQRQGRYRA